MEYVTLDGRASSHGQQRCIATELSLSLSWHFISKALLVPEVFGNKWCINSSITRIWNFWWSIVARSINFLSAVDTYISLQPFHDLFFRMLSRLEIIRLKLICCFFFNMGSILCDIGVSYLLLSSSKENEKPTYIINVQLAAQKHAQRVTLCATTWFSYRQLIRTESNANLKVITIRNIMQFTIIKFYGTE